MKVLQVINSLATGGAEKLLLDTVPMYNNMGIKTDVLVLQDIDYPFIKQLQKATCCSIYKLTKGSVYNPLLIFKIIPIIKQYDIIHVHLFPAQYWVVIAKFLSFSKATLIFTEHSTSNRRLKNKILKKFNTFIYRYYYKTICISKDIQAIYNNYTKLSLEKFPIIENGVDISKITHAKPILKNQIHPSIKKDDILLIQVASFRKPKDQSTVIRAMRLLSKNTKLLLVGAGERRAQCEQLAKELNLEKQVIFLGNRYDVPQLLKTADIIILSSHHEGLSLSCIEGMASGKPFIASDVPGLSNIVKDAGILFPKGNDKVLAAEIKKLVSDSIYYNKVAELCLARAKNYDIKKMVQKHIDLYKKLENK